MSGLADVRICGDEASVKAVLDVLAVEFRTTSAREYDGGQRAYLQPDTGNTAPGPD
ncbi:hypothetical protein [Streptomyces sp. NPDC004291]